MRTARIVNRNRTRNTIGKAKKQWADMEKLLMNMFLRGVRQGSDLAKANILNAAAHLTYEETPTNDNTTTPSEVVGSEGVDNIDVVEPDHLADTSDVSAGDSWVPASDRAGEAVRTGLCITTTFPTLPADLPQ